MSNNAVSTMPAAGAVANETVTVDRVKLDKAVTVKAAKVEEWLDKLSEAIDAAVVAEVWLDENVVDADGKRFRTMNTWLANRLGAQPILSAARKPLAVALVARGLSLREAAEAAQISKDTVARAVKAAEGGDGEGVANETAAVDPVAAADKAAKAAKAAIDKATGALNDMSDSDIDALLKAMAGFAVAAKGEKAARKAAAAA